MSADEKTSEDARGRSGANCRTRPQEEPGTREQPACGSATGGHLRRYSHDVPARIAAFTVTHVTTQRWHGHSARAERNRRRRRLPRLVVGKPRRCEAQQATVRQRANARPKSRRPCVRAGALVERSREKVEKGGDFTRGSLFDALPLRPLRWDGDVQERGEGKTKGKRKSAPDPSASGGRRTRRGSEQLWGWGARASR